jgi:predicted amino acid-binding ACT domain protein
LDFIIARRRNESSGKAVVFVTPLRGDREIAAAAEAGFNVADSIHSVRIQGQNQPGLAAEITGKLARHDINIRGLSAAELGTRFVMYVGLDTEEDAERAASILQEYWGASETGWHKNAA